MKQTFYEFFLLVLFAGIYSCNCFNTKCDTCPPYSYTWKEIYYYDQSFISKNVTQYIYIYELNSSGQTIQFDSIYNRNFDNKNTWNLINLNYFEYHNGLNTGNASTKIFVATLKDSTFPVRIENIKIGFKDGGKECCSCDDYFTESIKINGKEYKPEDLPIKIK